MEPTPSEPRDELLVTGDLVLDVPAHQAWAGSQQIHLSHLQFVVLTALVRRAGEIVSAEELIAATAGVAALTQRGIRSTISRVRRRLGRGPSRPRIEVARTRGYRLVVPA